MTGSTMQPEQRGQEMKKTVISTFNSWWIVARALHKITFLIWILFFLTAEFFEICSMCLSIVSVKVLAKRFVFQ